MAAFTTEAFIKVNLQSLCLVTGGAWQDPDGWITGSGGCDGGSGGGCSCGGDSELIVEPALQHPLLRPNRCEDSIGAYLTARDALLFPCSGRWRLNCCPLLAGHCIWGFLRARGVPEVKGEYVRCAGGRDVSH